VAQFAYVPLIFAAAAQLGRKTQARHQFAHLIKVIALVQAQALRILQSRQLTLYHQSSQGCLCQFHIVSVGPIHRNGHRYAMRLGQQTALDAAFAAIRKVEAGFFPPSGALVMLPSSASHDQSILSKACSDSNPIWENGQFPHCAVTTAAEQAGRASGR
jgi:hypothetical protein